MNSETKNNAYIEIVSEREPERPEYRWVSENGICNVKRIPLGFFGRSSKCREEDILNICREHYYENEGTLGRMFGRILSYKYYFCMEDFLEYTVNDIYSLITA